MKKSLAGLAVFIMCLCFSFKIDAQRKPPMAKTGKICGNPNIKCRTGDLTFQPHEIQFESPRGNNAVYESEFFYAVILKSVKLRGNVTCDNAISEDERLATQDLFADNKVFALKCSDAGDIYYSNIANDVNFIAVYGGRTLAEANKFLKTVQATGKFKGANVRRMQAGFNGT